MRRYQAAHIPGAFTFDSIKPSTESRDGQVTRVQKVAPAVR